MVAGYVGVEEGVDVATDDVDHFAELGDGLLPDVKRLSGRARSAVSSSRESLFAGGDERREFRRGAVSIEHSLVTDNNQLNQLELAPRHNLGDLFLSAGDSSVGDEDTEDQLEAGDLAG